MTIEVPELQSPRQEPQMFSGPATKPKARKDPAAEVGYFLWRERETRGLSIEQASDATGIHPYHIEAIETGDLTHMPPRLEAMEMIAGYAQFLGFEPEPLLEHLATFLPAPPLVRPQFHPARPPILSSAKVLQFGKMPKIPSLNINLNKFPGGSGGVIASLATAFVLLAGSHWLLSGHSQGTAPGTEQTAQAAPKATSPAAAGNDELATASTSSTAADVKVTDTPAPEGGKLANALPAEDDPDALGTFIQDQATDPAAKTKPGKAATASTKIQDRIKPEEQLKVASANPIPQPSEGRVYGAENKDARIVLKATAPVWLRIEDAQGIAVMTQMLNTGDTYRVPNRDGLIALSRDGGRLAFMIDGQEKGVLGPPGKILVSEKLDVAALESKK
ncbi:MAG: helix-turn-helix domain-containing protein [Alphaproteobacteria bacterium]|nr:helix-turn-helix domain-containing protein [Alphaproteobacteria bacterium]